MDKLKKNTNKYAKTPKEARQEEKRSKNRKDKQKNNIIEHLNPTISIITTNVNHLYLPIKTEILRSNFKKTKLYNYVLL